MSLKILRLSEYFLPWRMGARRAACVFLAILLVLRHRCSDRIAPGQYRVTGLDDTVLHLAIIERMAAGETVYSSIGTELRARWYLSGSTANCRTPAALLDGRSARDSAHQSRVCNPCASDSAPWRVSPAAPVPRIVVRCRSVPGGNHGSHHCVSTCRDCHGGILGRDARRARARVLSLPLVDGGGALRRGRNFRAAIRCAVRRRLRAVRPVRTAASRGRRLGRRRSRLCRVSYLLHAQAVSAAMLPTDWSWPHSWARFLGWPFVLQTAWVAGWTLFLPYTVTPIMAVLALAGAFARSMPQQLRWLLVVMPCCSARSASRSIFTGGLSRSRSGHTRCYTALRVRSSSYPIAEVCSC